MARDVAAGQVTARARGRVSGVALLVIVVLVVLVAVVGGGLTFFWPFLTAECLVKDQATLVSGQEMQGRRYELYRLVAGVSDKVETLALFDRPVAFDDCGAADREPVHVVSLDTGPEGGMQLRWVAEVRVVDNQILVAYSNTPTDGWTVQWPSVP